MKIYAIVQARYSSTRLPGKIFLELPKGSGITCLGQVIRRLKQSKKLDDVIIATTIGGEDDRTVESAIKEGVKHFRGSKENVLSRYYFAAKNYNADIIVRVTSDCPCVDPKIVDQIIYSHIIQKADYTSNNLQKTYPHGLDVEVFNFNVLERAYYNATDNYDKEHVTPYIYNHPGIFRLNIVKAPRELYAPNIRVTLDTREDYIFLCELYHSLYYQNENFTAYDIVNKLINKK